MWEFIRVNSRKSLLMFIILGVLLLLLGYIFGRVYFNPSNADFGLYTAAAVWLLLSLLSRYTGSSILLSLSGAKKINPNYFIQLYNVTEEMTIAAGLSKMPDLYIVDDDSPNAFATSTPSGNSSIVVTSSLLAMLSRDELQGVIAHEISHIANHDSQFMTFTSITLGCISFAADVFLMSFGVNRIGVSSSDILGYNSTFYYTVKFLVIAALLYLVSYMLGAIILAGIAALFIPWAGKALYYSVSRKREFLADASAVRLTRYPEGLASALEKLAGDTATLHSANSLSESMYIVSPRSTASLSFFDIGSTHPSVWERIHILRSIARGSAKNYHDAYRATTGRSHKSFTASALLNETILQRAPSIDSIGEMNAVPGHREVHDSILRMKNYSFLQCGCGMKIKIPEGFGMNRPRVTCPKCGFVHNIDV